MRKTILLTGLLVCCLARVGAQTAPEWRNPSIPALDKEYPATEFISYTSREDAENNDYNSSPYYRPLDGKWKFRWVDSHRKIVPGFYDPSFDDSGWDETDANSDREPQRHGLPDFVSRSFDIQGISSKHWGLPDEVPVGMYRTEFTMPFAWADKQVFLNIARVGSGTYVYVNGERVGYAEDSLVPAAFDITGHVREGRNTLALETYRITTGNLLENQDVPYAGGVERGVYIKALPKVRVRDFEIRTDLTDNYRNGVLDFGVLVKSHLLNEKNARIHFELFSPEGELLKTQYKDVSLRLRQEQPVHFDALVPGVRPWSAENPQLYTVMIRLQYEGRYVEYIRRKVGFRSVKVDGNQLLVNGKPIRIKGINMYGFDSRTGRSEESLRKEFRLMKELNVNAIRANCDPRQTRFYELCDEYGFYVCSEANINSYGVGGRKNKTLGNNPEFLESHLERVRARYERTKNYPSVILFSLGNEAGNGYNFYEAYLWYRSREKQRPAAFEGAGLEWNTDITFPVHNSLTITKQGIESASGRPYILSGYRRGTDGGSENPLDLWNDLFHSFNHFQGGFIWDWADLSDRAQNPDRAGVKEAYRDVLLEAGDLGRGEVRITNRHHFTNLDELTLNYTIRANGKTVSSGTVPCAAAPGETTTVRVNTALKKIIPDAEYLLTLEMTRKNSPTPLPTSYIVVSEDFKLPLGRK